MHIYRIKNFTVGDMPISLLLQKWSGAGSSDKHIHDFIEIIYVLKGGGVNFINDVAYPIIAGDVYIINRGATHSFYTDGELAFYNLMFLFEIFSDKELQLLEETAEFKNLFKIRYSEPENGISGKLFIPQPMSEKLKTAFDRLYEELRNTAPGYQINAKAWLSILITELCRTKLQLKNSNVNIKQSNSSHDPLAKALDFINKNYLKTLSLDEIAASANLSRTYISEFFHNRTGTQIFRYINTLRIEKARLLLSSEENMNISEISTECGFDDSSYFTRVFREITGVPPRSYRQSLKVKSK